MISVLRSLFLNRSVLLQLSVALVACQLLAHVVTLVFVAWRYERPDLLNATSVSTTQAVAFHELLGKTPASELSSVITAIERAFPWARVVEANALGVAADNPSRASDVFDGLARARPEMTVGAVLTGAATPDPLDDRIALALNDGRYLEFSPEVGEERITLPRVVILLFFAMVMVPLAVLAIWALAMLTAPLRHLAWSADRFSIDLDPTPLPAKGPAEIRKLANAFNTMKGRIRQLVDSRSRMLAAVSHDLRTPLTRLRLKTEALADSEDKEKMLRDIASMNAMIGQALSFLRDQTTNLAREPVDLSVLLESICNDYEDMGASAAFVGPRNIVCECEPELLTRAVSNLVDNAIKFGGCATVRLSLGPDAEAIIVIEDDGPGIPDDRKGLVFEPFSRGDAAHAEGFGLGLAIAKQIVERHGGRISLLDRQPSGLRVHIALPRALASAPTTAASSAPKSPVGPPVSSGVQ